MLLRAGEQYTLGQEARVEGRGIHSGSPALLSARPAAVDSGIILRRRDIAGEPELMVSPGRLKESRRSTTLQIRPDSSRLNLAGAQTETEPGSEIATCEHLLAALAATGIDNVLLELEGAELPSRDGSGNIFLSLLQEAGFKAQGQPRCYFIPERPIILGQGEAQLLLLPPSFIDQLYDQSQNDQPQRARVKSQASADIENIVNMANMNLTLELEYHLDYGPEPPGYQRATFELDQRLKPQERLNNFARELAPARTFALKREFRALKKQGLAGGAEAQEALLFSHQGPNQKLRFINEPARHKLLDLLGDLYLAGPLIARVLAVRSGHRHNHELARKIAAQRDQEKKQERNDRDDSR